MWRDKTQSAQLIDEGKARVYVCVCACAKSERNLPVQTDTMLFGHCVNDWMTDWLTADAGPMFCLYQYGTLVRTSYPRRASKSTTNKYLVNDRHRWPDDCPRWLSEDSRASVGFRVVCLFVGFYIHKCDLIIYKTYITRCSLENCVTMCVLYLEKYLTNIFVWACILTLSK